MSLRDDVEAAVRTAYARFYRQDPLAAAAYWFQVGAPTSHVRSAHWEQINGGPTSVDLTADELAVVEGVLKTRFEVPAGRASSAATEELVGRGVLLPATHGLALAPTHVRTVGCAAWHTRSLSVRGVHGVDGPAPLIARYALAGTRGVALAPHAEGVRFTAVDPPTAAARMAALVDQRPAATPAALPGEYSIELRWRHDRGAGKPPEHRAEQLHLAVTSAGVRWTSSRGRGRPEELTREQAAARLRKAVVRGEATDLEVADDVVAAEQRVQNAFSNRHDLTGEALDWLWPGLGGPRKKDTERAVKGYLVADYWRPASSWRPPSDRPALPGLPTFISRRR